MLGRYFYRSGDQTRPPAVTGVKQLVEVALTPKINIYPFFSQPE